MFPLFAHPLAILPQRIIYLVRRACRTVGHVRVTFLAGNLQDGTGMEVREETLQYPRSIATENGQQEEGDGGDDFGA